MAPPKTYRCEGIILGYKPLGEADLLVTMFTSCLLYTSDAADE